MREDEIFWESFCDKKETCQTEKYGVRYVYGSGKE